MHHKNLSIRILRLLCVVMISPSVLADGGFIAIESFFAKPLQVLQVNKFAINLISNTKPLKPGSIRNFNKLYDSLIYQVKVKVKGITYYRLVIGNYESQELAKQQLKKVKGFYPGAWIFARSSSERQSLKKLLTIVDKKRVVKKKMGFKTSISGAKLIDKLMSQAKQELIDQNYQRVVAIADKILEIGNDAHKQNAMEYLGLARERQNKFAQAIAIYKEFLKTYPDSKLAPKISNRLEGLKTMRMEPKKRLMRKERGVEESSWNIYGSWSQYYLNDLIERADGDSEEVNSQLVSDINIIARRKSNKQALVLRFDGGIANDFIDSETDARISRAMVRYTDDEADYQVIGGRQSRTAKGVPGRFDGIVFDRINHDINFSFSAGYPVQSSYDDVEAERRFLGGSLNFSPYDKIDVDVYMVLQEVSGLTDRQALGTEFQYRNGRGFLYGIIDYDAFYSELNNFTTITNYRIDDNWVVNLTYDYRNSPLLTTVNALQGQTVDNIADLKSLLTDEEIYQFAEDRTSKSQNFFVGSSYQIDEKQQLYLSLSLSLIEATKASGGIAETPESDDIYLAGDYTVRGFFTNEDYTTLGLRLSDTSSSEIISLRARSWFAGVNSLRYDPRLRLDYRKSKTSDIDQWIFKPSFKLTYKPTKNLNLEASVGIEYSNFDLPEFDDQITYNLLLGYVYRY